MGMFDTVFWDDGRRAQAKWWGRTLAKFVPGDAAQLRPYLWTGQPAETLWANRPDGKVPTSYQLVVRDLGVVSGAFITVLDGRLHAWDSARRSDLPLVDNRGCPAEGLFEPMIMAVETTDYVWDDDSPDFSES
jgi:hypothetical protein